MLDVTVVLLDDGLSSTAIMPLEIFHSAGALWNDLNDQPARPAFKVTAVSVDGGTVKSPYGLDLAPVASIAEVQRTDIVIVSTSGLEFEAKLVENSPLLPWLRRHHEQGAYLAGVCMGAAYLAESGLLDGRIATTHWALCEPFRNRWPGVRWRGDMFVTEENRVLCSGGVYAAMDISLYLVEKLCGHEVALQCAKALLLPMPRVHQSGYAVLPISKPHDDPRIRNVETWLQDNYHAAVSTGDLADRAGMSTRTFVRHFKAATGKAPESYLQALRMGAAKAMLERGGMPIQQVSSAVGYEDVAFFRGLFKRATGMTPAEYRAQFAPLQVRGHAVA